MICSKNKESFYSFDVSHRITNEEKHPYEPFGRNIDIITITFLTHLPIISLFLIF